MKILQICSARSIGGGERYLADLSNSLAQDGHDIFVAAAPNAPLKNELPEIPDDNILMVRMRHALDVSSARRLASFAQEKDIEIIHAHLARDYPLAALASKLSGVPFVLTRHVLFTLNPLHKLALRHVGGVIAPSEAIADALLAQKIFPSAKITRINYGIDIEHFSSRENRRNEAARLTVGTIGHLAPIKGHDVFIRAAEIVLRKYPQTQFIIVGEDKSASGKNRREIEELILRLDLKEKIRLTGWTDDVRPFLQQFDVFVSAARAEAFGLVMPEAMIYEIPVIATRSEGAVQIIENEVSGILIPQEDAATMAQEIIKLLNSPERRAEIGTAGRRRVEENFSLGRMVSQTEEFYRRILEK